MATRDPRAPYRTRRDAAKLRAVKITGERVVTPGGRLQPDVAAPRRRLRARRAATSARAACSTSAAASATATTCWRRARRSASTSTPEALAGQERETVVADMRALPFDDGELRLGALGPVARARARSRARARRGRARARARTASAVFVTPNRLTLGRPDEIIDPYHSRRVRRRPSCGALCARALRRGRGRAGCSAPTRYMELFDEERAKLDRLLRLDPLRLRRLVPRRAAPVALRPAMLRRYRHAGRPARRGDRARRLRAARRRTLDAALDVVAVCESAGRVPRRLAASRAASGAARRSTTAPSRLQRPHPLRGAAAPPPPIRGPPRRS